MRVIWAKLAMMLVGACLTLGCKTAQPELKPPLEKEVLNSPPSEARFNSPVMPAQAFKDRDSLKFKAMTTPELTPTRGPGAMGGTGTGMPQR